MKVAHAPGAVAAAPPREVGFSSRPSEIRGLLRGDLQQLCRPVRPQPRVRANGEDWAAPQVMVYSSATRTWVDGKGLGRDVPCPMGRVGDRLRMLETWAQRGSNERACASALVYRADEPLTDVVWRSPTAMPHWACRLWCEVTHIGVDWLMRLAPEQARCQSMDLVQFADQWDEHHGSGDFARNPLVWCVGVRRESKQS